MAIDFSAVRAFTFDCYGTLVDWEQGILRAVRPVLAVNGVRAADDEIIRAYAEAEAAEESGEYQPYRDVLGGVMERLADRFGWALDPKERPRIADSLARWPVYPDAARALHVLGLAAPLVVCSNIDDDLFAPARAGLESGGAKFSYVVTAQYVRSYKPDPRHFRVALALLGLEPHDVLHVAQSRHHDIAPARAMGMQTAWINRPSCVPGTGVAPGSDAEPHAVFTSMAQLADAVARG